MALFQKTIGPVFLKEDSDTSTFIEKMKALSEEASPKIKEEIDKQIKLASFGEAGEKNIAFELKNSGMDMYILHDIYLEQEDLSAQIDYLIVCRKKIYVLECKNLIGDIEVDSNGQFIRKYEINGKKYKESIYSPITQNERHLNVLKEVRKASNLESIKAEQESFYQVEDKNGKGIFNDKSVVEAQVYRNGILYKITESEFKKKKSFHSIMKYNDETKEWNQIEEEQFIDFLAVDTYTQKQIYELAQTPDALSKLIDKDNLALPELLNSAENTHEKLVDKIKELRVTKNKIKDESRLCLELKDINDQIDVFKKSGITVAIEEKTKYESQKKEIDLYINGIKNLGDEIIEWANKEHISDPKDDLSDDIKAIF